MLAYWKPCVIKKMLLAVKFCKARKWCFKIKSWSILKHICCKAHCTATSFVIAKEEIAGHWQSAHTKITQKPRRTIEKLSNVSKLRGQQGQWVMNCLLALKPETDLHNYNEQNWHCSVLGKTNLSSDCCGSPDAKKSGSSSEIRVVL